MLIFLDDNKIGSIFWYENGRVRLRLHEGYIKPGHAKQLFCNGFSKLIADSSLLLGCVDTVHHVGGSLTVSTGKRLKYIRIDDFKKSHGIDITLGDSSHPESGEIQYGIPECMKPLSDILNERNDYYVSNLDNKNKKSDERDYIF